MSLKGQPTLQIITGSDRDNATILLAISGSGETLRPLIIFQGKKSKQHGIPKQGLITIFILEFTQTKKGG